MSYTFDDAVHILGMDITDDDVPADDFDYTDPGQDQDAGHRYEVTIAWDGNPADAKWYATAFGGLARRRIEGCVVTFVDHAAD